MKLKVYLFFGIDVEADTTGDYNQEQLQRRRPRYHPQHKSLQILVSGYHWQTMPEEAIQYFLCYMEKRCTLWGEWTKV